MQPSIVRCKEIAHRLADIKRGHQVRQNLCPVNPPPEHRVIRHFVKLIPRQLGRHKIINSALLHNLRQCAGVAKHIRQPEYPVVDAEFLFKKPLPVQELAHQGLSGCEIAVSLHPHAALGFPASFPHTLFYLRIQLRIALLQECIELGLARHKTIPRIFLHQL